jgi:agmatine/peptidylarginine deiminase
VAEVLLAWDTEPEFEPFFADLASVASESAPVTILLSATQQPARVSAVVREFGANMGNIRILEADVDSVWVRDYGPLVVREGGRKRVVDPRYFGEQGDDQAPKHLAEKHWSLPLDELPLDIEGGNLLSNGTGMCLTTETAIRENGHRLSVEEIHELLRTRLGCTELVVLTPLVGESTGHVDMFATFTAANEVIVGEILEGDHENAMVLDENAAQLAALGMKVRRIPMSHHDDGLYRTYTNAMAINEIVIVPVYPEDDRYQDAALRVFADAYPLRTIIPIVASEIIERAGAVHCVGMTVAL